MLISVIPSGKMIVNQIDFAIFVIICYHGNMNIFIC